jgi:hypothetical protein
MNGTVLINSKDPFTYQGIKRVIERGVTNMDKSQRSDVSSFHDFSLRWAKAFNNKFAFKIGCNISALLIGLPVTAVITRVQALAEKSSRETGD